MLYPKTEAANTNDFRIYSCTAKHEDVMLNSYDCFSIKGVMQRLELGTEYSAEITLDKVDPRFGATYNVVTHPYQEIPETIDGQRDFLSTMMTETQLTELYKAYPDEDVIKLILEDKLDHKKVKHFGEKTVKKIKERIEQNIEFKDMLGKYARFGINYDTLVKLKNIFGSMQLASQKLDECPYVLTQLSGYGFKKADKIARAMGVQLEDVERLKYGIRYTIEENEQQGHTFIYRDELIKSASEKLEVEESLIEKEICKTENLKIINDKIALQNTYNAEFFISKKLKELMNVDNKLDFDVEDFIRRMESKHNIKLTHQQRDFFHMIKNNSVGVLIGFAGVGKSFMQKLTVELLEDLNLTYSLLSPTGKAAKLLSKYTERPAHTIHKAVGYGLPSEIRELIEITDDFVIIDEMSMTDCFIMDMLLKKITNPKARILLCGDPAQLSAVGAANLLHDFVESGVIPVTKLDIVFRQKEGGLLDVITRIRQGEKIIPYGFTGRKVFGNDFIIHCVNQSDMTKGFKYYYDYFMKESIPRDITIITPTRKGIIGTVEINKYIQSIVNGEGGKKEHCLGENTVFRIGDYVINTRNMYGTLDYQDNSIDIVNGDTGVILNIVKDKDKDEYEGQKEKDKNGIVVKFESGIVRIGFENANQLLHAWSMTAHRMQGSAAEYTISLADKSHTFQLSRNQLYTMLSSCS